MFYVLSKVLPLLIYPTGLASLLLVLSLILRRRRPPHPSRGNPTPAAWDAEVDKVPTGTPQTAGARRSADAPQAAGARQAAGAPQAAEAWPNLCIVAALLLIAVGGNRLVSMHLVRWLEWQVPPLSESTLANEEGAADAIVVLGGGTRQQLAPRPWHEVGEAGDRVIYAARLYQAGVAPKVLVSGAEGSLSNPGLTSESTVMADMLVFFGVPREAILLENRSRNTYENAVESAGILAAEGLNRVVLVTSAMHMPRAYGVFLKTDLTVLPAPTDYLLTHSDWVFYRQPDLGLQLINLLPKAEYLEMTEKALKELIGIAVYRLQGWL
jgi:uncharacterized SAM-binding protein YcdF (DUF218 family)